jgi:aconitase A
MAVLAVLVAVASLLGHRAHTEEVVLQAKASDQWAYYQAKNIRQHLDQLFTDLTSLQSTANIPATAKLRDQYAQEASRYKNEQNEAQAKANELETEVATQRKRADRFDLGEVFLEIGLVITSITLLSGRRLYWAAGIICAAAGVIAAATAFFVR